MTYATPSDTIFSYMLESENLHQQLLNKISDIYHRYSSEYRATTQPFHLQSHSRGEQEYQYDPDNWIIRESLIEHVGSLPIITSFLYPYIQDDQVDLGYTLALLSIHDIGELAVGDEITFTKKQDKKDAEAEAALKLLHTSLHSLYLEAENLETKNAKFAKSIDKITPDILDLLTPPEITIARYEHFLNIKPPEIVPLIKEHKHPYMTWNPFLTQFHLFLLNKIEESLNIAAASSPIQENPLQ